MHRLFALYVCGWLGMTALFPDSGTQASPEGEASRLAIKGSSVIQNEEKKQKKSSKKKEAKSQGDAKKSAPESGTTEATKGTESAAKKEPAKKDDGFGWATVLVAVVVSFAAGAGLLWVLFRRRLAAPPPAPPKQIPSTLEAAVVVVESKVAHSEPVHHTMPQATPAEKPAQEKTAIQTDTRKEDLREVATSGATQANSDARVKQTPTVEQPAEKVTAKEEHPVPSPASKVGMDKMPTTPETAEASELLLDDNAIDLAENRSSNKDLLLLSALTQDTRADKEEDTLSDQLLLPEEPDLLLSEASQTGAPASLLPLYAALSTPESEKEFLRNVVVCTMSNFDEVFGNPALRPEFRESEAGSFWIARQPNADGYYEMFLLPSFPISDFLMRESIAPVYELCTASEVQTGFQMRSPALVKRSGESWVLVAKGQLIIPA